MSETITKKEQDVSELNLHQRLAKIRKQVCVMSKTKDGYGYKYTPLEDILAKVTTLMEKYHVSLIPVAGYDRAETRDYTYTKTKYDKETRQRYDEPVYEIIVCGNMSYLWVNDDNPEETIEVPWYFVGQQSDAAQAFGAAMSYAMRYFLINYFQIATTESDVDAWRKKQREAETAEDRAAANEIIKAFDEELRAYLADHQDKSADVKALVTKYVKSGDYNKIVEPALAAKLYQEFKSNFTEKEVK